MDDGGVLDEALQRLHTTGPEFRGWLSNHAPMAVEALTRHGHARTVHSWIDDYLDRLDEAPRPSRPITADGWREALGDPRRLADWTSYFSRQVAAHPWRAVLAVWWPRLLPGISGAATHPVIRVGHAVRTLLRDGQTAPRRTELAHALAYWAARHAVLPDHRRVPSPPSAAASLEVVRPVKQEGGIRPRLARITELPDWPGDETPSSAEAARERLRELVRAATHRYVTHGHGEPVMLVHAATAPNAVLRTLPALPPEQWWPSLSAAWGAGAAVTASYTARARAAVPAPGPVSAEEVFARAADHGDAHVVKFADTALDVGDTVALAAGLRAATLIERPR